MNTDEQLHYIRNKANEVVCSSLRELTRLFDDAEFISGQNKRRHGFGHWCIKDRAKNIPFASHPQYYVSQQIILVNKRGTVLRSQYSRHIKFENPEKSYHEVSVCGKSVQRLVQSLQTATDPTTFCIGLSLWSCRYQKICLLIRRGHAN